MSYNNLDITNVVNVQVAQPPAGLSNYKVNNLALVTKESPVNGSITAQTPGIYLSPLAVAADWGITSQAYAIANAIFSQEPNILDGGGSLIIYPMGSGDTLSVAIAALEPLMFFGGLIWGGYSPTSDEITAAVTAIQPLRRMLGVVSSQLTDLSSGGLFPTVLGMNCPQARMFVYSGSDSDSQIAMAAYMSRLMSTNFEGSNTTQTMQMKDLIGISPDPLINQSYLNACSSNGVDCYATIAGLPKVFSSGTNDFSDNVYNQNWFVFALEVALTIPLAALAFPGIKLSPA